MSAIVYPTTQRRLALEVSAEVTLCTIEAVRMHFGCDAESVITKIESGQLRWVWDFSSRPDGYRRELRFWAAELRAQPEGRPHAEPDSVIRKVIGEVIGKTPPDRVRSAVMEVRWTISAQLVRTLVDEDELEGPIVGHTRYLTRSSMEQFLLRRMVV